MGAGTVDLQNIFSELGFADDEAAVEAWRSDFAGIVRNAFVASRKSQQQLADELDIKQSVLSRIINGNTANISVEYLLKVCIRLGIDGCAQWGPSVHDAVVLASDNARSARSTNIVELQSSLAPAQEPVKLQAAAKPFLKTSNISWGH